MRRFLGVVSFIILALLFCSGAFVDIVRFFAWLFTLQYSAPETSVAGGIIVRILTFLISYGLVGVLFTVLDWFDSRAMKIVYFVVSTLIGFALAYLVWTIETHIVIIGIIMGVLLVGVVAFFVLSYIFDKGKEDKDDDE